MEIRGGFWIHPPLEVASAFGGRTVINRKRTTDSAMDNEIENGRKT